MEENEQGTDDKSGPDKISTEDGQPVNPQAAVPTLREAPPPGDPRVYSNAEDSAVHQAQSQSATSPKNKKRIDPSSLWMVILTAIIALATGANVWIFYLESESTGKQIDRLTDKAGGIVDSMNHALSDNRDALSKAFEANRNALIANEKQAKTALDASVKASNLQLRPYLVAAELEWVDRNPASVNGFRYANVRFRNTGQTPAFDAQPYGKLFFRGPFTSRTNIDDLIDPLFKEVRPIYKASGQDVPPSPAVGTIFQTGDLGHKPSQTEMTASEKGDAIFIFVGGIFYKDVEGTRHETQFCRYFNGPLNIEGASSSWHICVTHNTIR